MPSSSTPIPFGLPLTTLPPAIVADFFDADSDVCDSESDPSGFSDASGDTVGSLTDNEIEIVAIWPRSRLDAH